MGRPGIPSRQVKTWIGALGRNRTCDTRFRNATAPVSPTCGNGQRRRSRTAVSYWQILRDSVNFSGSRGPHAAQPKFEAFDDRASYLERMDDLSRVSALKYRRREAAERGES